MNETELELIRSRAEKATPGPWQWWNLEAEDQGWTDNGPDLETVERGTRYSDGSQGAKATVINAWGHDAWGIDIERADALFIAHARTDIPLLLAEVDRLRFENEHPVVDAHTFDGLMQENAKLRELIKTGRAEAWDEGRHAGVELVNTGAAFTTRRHDAENPYRSLAEDES